MALDVTVNIKVAEIVGKAGTWFPCLYTVSAELEEDAYDEYTKLSDLADAEYQGTTYGTDTDVYKAAAKLFAQEGKPNKIAVLAQSAFSADTMADYLVKGWRQFILVGTHTNIANIAKYFEENTDKMLFVGQDDTGELSTLYTSVKDYDRTFIVYHATDPYAVAAVVGATAGLAVGSFTYKNIRIADVEPMDLSATAIDNIHKSGAITIVEKVGDVVTSEGIVASGEFADIVDAKDYIVQNISYNTQKVLNINNKVPYTNQGISMLETATISALTDAYNNGMIADNDDGTPAYSTKFALRSETTETDRAERDYPYGTFTFALAGAIHTVVVNGTITL